MLDFDKIELFENLSQLEDGGRFFDFHNDYDCVKIQLLTSGILILLFQKINGGDLVNLRFVDTVICQAEFFNTDKVNNLTIDNLYRGRVKKGDDLVELDGGRGYFYLEFDEGQTLEFWSVGLEIE